MTNNDPLSGNTNPQLPTSQPQPQAQTMDDVLGSQGFAPNAGAAGAPGSDTINLDGVSADNAFGFPVVEAGEYNCVCTDVEWKQSVNSGNWMLQWQFTIIEGSHTGHKFTDYTVVKKADGTIDERGLAKIKRYVSILNPEYQMSNFSPATYAQGNEPVSRQIRLRVNKGKDNQNPGSFRNNIQDADVYRPVMAGSSDASPF